MIQVVEINNENVLKRLNKLQTVGGDLRPVFETIVSDYYKSNEMVFRGSPGKFADLSEKYKKVKQKKAGFIYPILLLKGHLKASLTRRNNALGIERITPKTLELGTKANYAGVLQFGSKKRNIPARPFLGIDVGGRQRRWIRIIEEAISRAIA